MIDNVIILFIIVAFMSWTVNHEFGSHQEAQIKEFVHLRLKSLMTAQTLAWRRKGAQRYHE